MTCKETQEFISAYLDRQLAPTDLSEVRLHLETCAACRAEEHAILRLKETLRTVSMPGMPADLLAAIENETIFKPRWWETAVFQKRWAPAMVGTAIGFGAWVVLRHGALPWQSASVTMAAAPAISAGPVVAMHRDQEPDLSEKVH